MKQIKIFYKNLLEKGKSLFKKREINLKFFVDVDIYSYIFFFLGTIIFAVVLIGISNDRPIEFVNIYYIDFVLTMLIPSVIFGLTTLSFVKAIIKESKRQRILNKFY